MKLGGRFVVLSYVLSFVSGLILPMKKPNEDPDMDSVISHVTLMEHTLIGMQTKLQSGNTELTSVKDKLLTAEKTITNLQTRAQNNNKELTIVKDRLHVSERELTALKAELRLDETDIAKLKHDQQKCQDSLERIQLKTELEALKSRQNIIEHELVECKALAQSTAADLKTVQTQVQTVSTDARGLRGELTAIRNKTNQDVAFQVTQRGSSILARINLPFDTVDLNTGNGYNKTTDMFTAPVSGTYIFWANIVFTDPVGHHDIYLRKASTILDKGVVSVSKSGSYHTASIMRTTHLKEGDQVHFTTTFTGSSIYGLGYSSYGGALLHVS